MDQMNLTNLEEQMHIAEVTSMDLPLDWENIYDADERAAGVFADSISDGLIKCLNHLGYVDIEYITAITGKDYRSIIEALRGSIYQNPENWGECFFKGWETADEYLSGNVKQKLDIAIQSNQDYNGYFQSNVDALTAALPKGIKTSDIYITLGSPWIPTDIIEDFVNYAQGPNKSSYFHFKLLHDDLTGTWEEGGYFRIYSYEFNERYGTKRKDAHSILFATLNMRSVAVYDTKKSDITKSGTVRILNSEETVLALEKQKLLIEDFQKWVWRKADRKIRLFKIYEDLFLNIRTRRYDGSFLELPNLNPQISLFPHQKNAIARILFSPNTLLAHDVGSGKTYIMIAAGMELKRLQLSKKNLYVVPNNILGQWKDIYLSMYPDAKLFCVEPKDFTPSKKEETLRTIRDNDFDGILMAYSCFSAIPISPVCEAELLSRELGKYQEHAEDAGKRTKQVLDRIEKLRDKRLEISDEKTSSIYFDDLGITRLFVDEAHNFKNVPFDTKIDRVLGISKTGSKKCEDMMKKVKILQNKNDGGGVVFATGTPITNSITDVFIMQSYLQSAELAILELSHFDSWVGMFAEKACNFEIDVDTGTYRLATRFSKFHNLPELTNLLAMIADFHHVDEALGIPTHEGYCDELIPKTAAFNSYLTTISSRADAVRNRRVRSSEDNMLKITTDGRKAALDLRLAQPNASFTTSSKVFCCAQNVSTIYKETMDSKSTQVIFCDTSTPKEGFNIYDELKSLLIKMGVAENEIAFIHDATTEAKREKLFKSMQKGNIRVLIGSTFKLGLGVNIQDKLLALHHLDVPWRPADMVQREGRILRQGNENPSVKIYRYITKGSFDAYSWQLLETKQHFIEDLLSGSMSAREGSDISDTALNYAEVKALAVGNPLLKERVEVSNELSRYHVLQKKLIDTYASYRRELSELPTKIEEISALIPLVKADMEYYKENKKTYCEDEHKEIRHLIHEKTHGQDPSEKEEYLLEYQGFSVIAPARVSTLHPVVKLIRNSKYTIELTITELGGMNRIDRCLNELEDRYEKLCTRLDNLKARQTFMQEELLKNESYIEQINTLKQRILDIDEKLGVKTA